VVQDIGHANGLFDRPLKDGLADMGPPDPKSETRNPKSETRKLKTEIRNQSIFIAMRNSALVLTFWSRLMSSSIASTGCMSARTLRRR